MRDGLRDYYCASGCEWLCVGVDAMAGIFGPQPSEEGEDGKNKYPTRIGISIENECLEGLERVRRSTNCASTMEKDKLRPTMD